MANMTSVTYTIEGSEEILQNVNNAITASINNKEDKRYKLHKAAEYLNIPKKESQEIIEWDEENNKINLEF